MTKISDSLAVTKKVKFMIILSGLGMVSDDLVMKNKKKTSVCH